jgi:hypothetical protein
MYQKCLRPSKIYQNWDFGFVNIPSGNPEENYAKHFLRQPRNNVLDLKGLQLDTLRACF